MRFITQIIRFPEFKFKIRQQHAKIVLIVFSCPYFVSCINLWVIQTKLQLIVREYIEFYIKALIFVQSQYMSSFIPQEFISVALKKVLPVLMLNKLCFFCIYKYTKNACVIDVGYTFGHFLAGVCYAYYQGDLKSTDTKIKLAILGLWTLRLGGFLLRNRIMQGYHDPRYEQIFKKFPPNTLGREGAVLGQYIFQGFIVLVTSSPLFWTFKNKLSWNVGQLSSVRGLNYAAIAISLLSIVLEGIADNQLQHYKDKKSQYKEGHIFSEGLWAKSRHPNLFFELLTWFGLAGSGIFSATDATALVGPISLFLVMDKLTVPITERYMKKTRGNRYLEFKTRTNKYLPF